MPLILHRLLQSNQYTENSYFETKIDKVGRGIKINGRLISRVNFQNYEFSKFLQNYEQQMNSLSCFITYNFFFICVINWQRMFPSFVTTSVSQFTKLNNLWSVDSNVIERQINVFQFVENGTPVTVSPENASFIFRILTFPVCVAEKSLRLLNSD